ncbi:MAG: endo alpha-1,4 polygalactosaminidase [Bacteroidia bacterium]|nr:endo alpha-1,4 polygalactosaminidase [Bacteroidia bacterium]
MVKFVGEISLYAKSKQSGFIIVLQNGEALAQEIGYLVNVDAVGIEGLSYGYDDDGSDEWTIDEITKIKQGLNNSNGGYVICYMSIGEAEDYRYYFKKECTRPNLFDNGGSLTGKAPNWMEPQNKNWSGNFKVRYWDKEWKNIIYGSSNSYLDKIISKGFDGVYLDIIDAYEYFEEKVNH